MKTWTVGVDVGVRSTHRAEVVDERFEPVFHARFTTHPEAIDRFLHELASRKPAEVSVRFVLEPTGSVWKTLAAYLVARGYAVYQATPTEVHGMRAAMGHRHRKTDKLDALALAKLPAVAPERIRPVLLPPDPRWEQLQRGVRREHKLARRIANSTNELQALLDEAIPGLASLFPDPAQPLAQAIYRYWSHPGRLARQAPEKLARTLTRQSGRPVSVEEAATLVELARQAVALGRAQEPAASALCREIACELRLFNLLTQEQRQVQAENYALYRDLDPQGHVQSLPGVGEVAAPALLSLKPLVDRLPKTRQLRAYSGYVPKVEQSGQRVGHPRMSKAGPAWLKRILYMAADAARRVDPQLAQVYRRAMMEKGAPHTKAVCAVVPHLLDRLFCVLKENRPYEFRDLAQQPVERTEARALAQALAVPEEVRRRLRVRQKAMDQHRRGPSRREGHRPEGPGDPQRERPPALSVPMQTPGSNALGIERVARSATRGPLACKATP
ncbi:IS110 family transposase [Carboxydochorda subterranea]|uniref:IS110 family transposase n=1 Tax=Carboxydichorda subterranea TaxID=3109565 RepID=A0ABZ1BUA3_9FIRM|nr:IS110 family transposase [Limnochorda sp. L945t]WRP16200.1 IS110 family transposase [Limnochorda sp. L945t]